MGGGVSVAAAEAGSVSMPGSIRPVAGSASGHGQAGPVIKPADDVRASVRRAMEEGSSSMAVDDLLALKKYVAMAYEADLLEAGRAAKDVTRLHEAATASTAFLLELIDLNRIPESIFKSMRRESIIQKFLLTDNDFKLPVARTLVEATLYVIDTEGVRTDKALAAIREEASAFLQAEVVPYWERTKSPVGLPASDGQAQAANALTTTGRRTSKEVSESFSEIIADPEQRAVLRDYMSSTPGAVDLLHFYLDMLDVKLMKLALLSRTAEDSKKDPQAGDVENLAKLIFSRLNKVYDRYLPIGSPVRALMTAEEMIDVMGSPEALGDVSAMDGILSRASTIILELAQDMSEDTVHRDLMAAARRERACKDQKLKDLHATEPASPPPPQPTTSPRSGGQATPASPRVGGETAGPRLSNSVEEVVVGGGTSVERNSNLNQREQSRKRLLALLEGHQLSRALKQAFATANLLPYLHFWRAVEDYKFIPIGQVIFIQSRAEKIFEKYFRRGSSTEVYMPTEVRNGVLGGLLLGDQHVYDRAQAVALDVLLLEHLVWESTPPSQGGPMSQELMEELDVFGSYPPAAQGLPTTVPPFALDESSGGGARHLSTQLPIPFEELISVPAYCNFLRLFAESEFCLETVLFCGDIQEARRLPRSDLQAAKMRKILNKYVKVGATMPLRLSSSAREQAVERMASNPGPATFHMAEQEVTVFLRSVLVPKFLKSREFASLEALLRETGRIYCAEYSKSYKAEDEQLNASQSGKRGLFSGTLSPRANNMTPRGTGTSTWGTTPRGTRLSGDDLSASNKGRGATHKAAMASGHGGQLAERTFRNLLMESTAVKLFYDFCCAKDCEEYLLFWLDADDFKNIPGTDFSRLRARKIAGQYLQDGARNPITLSPEVKEELLRNLESPSPQLFAKAQDGAFQHMLKTSFAQYIDSPEYKRAQGLIEQYVEVGTSLEL